MVVDGRHGSSLLQVGSLLAAALLGVVRAQDNTQPTAEELQCWDAHNGGAFYDPDTATCEVCVAGRYDHDAIDNMPHMNMALVEGVMVITWWDGTTDYNPVRASPLLRFGFPRAAPACTFCPSIVHTPGGFRLER